MEVGESGRYTFLDDILAVVINVDNIVNNIPSRFYWVVTVLLSRPCMQLQDHNHSLIALFFSLSQVVPTVWLRFQWLQTILLLHNRLLAFVLFRKWRQVKYSNQPWQIGTRPGNNWYSTHINLIL